MTFKYLIVFSVGALSAALAKSQIHEGPKGIPGTDRPWQDFVGKNYGIPVMHLGIYGGTNSGTTGPWNTAAIGPVLEVRKPTSLECASLLAHSTSNAGKLAYSNAC